MMFSPDIHSKGTLLVSVIPGFFPIFKCFHHFNLDPVVFKLYSGHGLGEELIPKYSLLREDLKLDQKSAGPGSDLAGARAEQILTRIPVRTSPPESRG
jgi:hypothetical protein